jgi:hypothetical protein
LERRAIARMAWFIFCTNPSITTFLGTYTDINYSRGKKVFKKFAEMGDPDETPPPVPDDGDLEISLDRSAIRPRLLFPPKASAVEEDPEEEEAETDVEAEAEVEAEPTRSSLEPVVSKGKEKEPLSSRRDISRMTPESEDDAPSVLAKKGLSKRRSIFDAGDDGELGRPIKGLFSEEAEGKGKRGLGNDFTLGSPRRVKGKRARV